MVFKKLFAKFKREETAGLGKFSGSEQERILQAIANKEADILRKQADLIIDERVERLERKAGLNKKKGSSGIKDRLSRIKEFRQRNLARRAANLAKTKKTEELFRAGKLNVKPVGTNQPSKKLDIKPFELKPRKDGLK